MNAFGEIVSIVLSCAVGYIVGRVGHCYLNGWLRNPHWAPHHWIWGVALIILGLSRWQSPVGPLTTMAGLGLWASDLKDFWRMRFFAPDEDGPKRFWHID